MFEGGSLFFQILLAALHPGDGVGRRIGYGVTLAAVEGERRRRERLLQRGTHTDHGGDAHRAGHDRDVAGLRALGGHEAQSHAPRDARRVRRSQVAGYDHRRPLQSLQTRGGLARDLDGYLTHHVAHVVGAGGHVGVFHAGEQRSVLLADREHGGLRALKTADALGDAVGQLRVLGKLDVRVEDRRLVGVSGVAQLVRRLR